MLVSAILPWLACGLAAANAPTAGAGGAQLGVVSRSTVADLVNRYALEYGIDPRLLDALIRVESAYDPRAVSHKGAMGLMQLMPATARRLSVSDPFDPEQNIRGGAAEFARLLDVYSGQVELALAAYNAGEGAVARYGGIPPYRETRNYVARIMTLYTGKPWGWRRARQARPVSLVRDPESGEVLITNERRTSDPVISGGSLGGGFGRSSGGQR